MSDETLIEMQSDSREVYEPDLDGLMYHLQITGTDTDQAIKPRNLLNRFTPHYKITPTVSSNDLVVTVTHADDTTPSATRPLWFNIANTWRKHESSLTITIPDGTNYFDAGSATMGTNVVGYFTYVVWDSNSSVVALSIARIPFGRLVSDFSATTTNVKHLYNYANFTSTDGVANIGYFEATLSLAGTSHLWTVPTYTNLNLKNEPTFRTNNLLFTPVFTNLSVGDGTLVAGYTVRDREFVLHGIGLTFGSTTSVSGSVSLTLPFGNFYSDIDMPKSAAVAYKDNGTGFILGAFSVGASNQLTVFGSAGTYANIVALSSTVPFTWTTSDEINIGQCAFLIV